MTVSGTQPEDPAVTAEWEAMKGAPTPDPVKGWDELRTSGLLWLINRTVFHPRGWALALVSRDGEIVGWQLLGDGGEIWTFGDSEDAHFAAAQAALTPHPAPKRNPGGLVSGPQFARLYLDEKIVGFDSGGDPK